MIVEFDKSFEKSLEKIKNKLIYTKIEQIIFTCETSPNLDKIPNVRKLSGFTNYYRLRLGDYRIGFEIINVNVIRFIIIAHRKDIYKMFP